MAYTAPCVPDATSSATEPDAPRVPDAGPPTAGFVAGLVVFVVALYGDVLSGERAFVYRDFGLQTLPVASYLRESLLRGELPLWNPYSFAGIPFAAQWSALALYPPSLLTVLVPPPYGLGLFGLLHLVLAGIAMQQLALRWVGDRTGAALAGLAYASSGFALSALEWPAYLAVIGWAPLVVLTAERAWREGGRALAIAALIGALQMLGGVPELIVMTWGIVGTLWIAAVRAGDAPLWPSGRRLAGLAALVAALAAVQLLPFLELVSLSERGADFGNDYWALPLWGLGNFFVPRLHTAQSIHGVTFQQGQELVGSYAVGIAATGFALFALRTRAWPVLALATVTVLALALAMGANLPGGGAVRALLPGIGLLRFPVKFVFVATLALPLLAAYGIRALARDGARPWPEHRVELGLAGVVLVIIAAIVATATAFPFPGDTPGASARSGGGQAVFWIASFGAVFALARARAGAARGIAVGILLTAVALDAATRVDRAPTAPASVYAPLEGRGPMPALGQGRAMLAHRARKTLLRSGRPNPRNHYLAQRRGLLQNTNLLEGIPKIDGHFWLRLGWTAEIHRRLYLTRPHPDGLLDFLGVTRLLDVEGGDLRWRARESALPVATGGQRPRFGDDPGVLVHADFDPRREVWLPAGLEDAVTARTNAAVDVSLTELGANTLRLEVEAHAPGWVVVARSYHPAWQARLDGSAIPVHRANHAFLAFEVPAGRHSIELRYRDGALRHGALVSGLGLLGCAILGFGRRKSA